MLLVENSESHALSFLFCNPAFNKSDGAERLTWQEESECEKLEEKVL